jgi:hypothetical protein
MARHPMKTQSERNELVGFIHRHDFAPTISQRGIAKAFDNRGRELEENYNPNVIIEALRPLAALSLTSVVIRTAERVDAADRKIRPGEPDTADYDEPAGQPAVHSIVGPSGCARHG